MANNITRISNTAACTAPVAADLILGASANSESNTGFVTVHMTKAQLLANTVAVSLVVSKTTTPANSADVATPVLANQIWGDGTYLYYAVSNTQIKRLGPFVTF